MFSGGTASVPRRRRKRSEWKSVLWLIQSSRSYPCPIVSMNCSAAKPAICSTLPVGCIEATGIGSSRRAAARTSERTSSKVRCSTFRPTSSTIVTVLVVMSKRRHISASSGKRIRLSEKAIRCTVSVPPGPVVTRNEATVALSGPLTGGGGGAGSSAQPDTRTAARRRPAAIVGTRFTGRAESCAPRSSGSSIECTSTRTL